MKTSGLIAIVMLWSLLGVGQDVHVSQGKGIVVLSVRAVKPYLLMSGEEKTATFAVVCTQKGKKTSHVLKFLPGEQLVEDTPGITATSGEFVFNMTIGGTKQMTEWALSDPVTFAFYSPTDAGRLKFIQALLSSGTVTIEFKPFLSGATTSSTFDLSKLELEMGKHPECSTTQP